MHVKAMPVASTRRVRAVDRLADPLVDASQAWAEPGVHLHMSLNSLGNNRSAHLVPAVAAHNAVVQLRRVNNPMCVCP